MEKVQTKWVVDPGHSVVQFKVKHLAISNITGIFTLFKGDVQSKHDDFNDSEIRFEIDPNSVFTNNDERDKHLKSEIFFDTQKFPKITFDGLLHKSDGNFDLRGDLTIRENKKSIILKAVHTGLGEGRFGDIRAGFEVDGEIDRKDFGLNFNLSTGKGTFVVGENIKLHFDIELIKQI